jgi:hypothetical protein
MRRIFLILTLVLTLAPVTVLAGGVSVLVGAQSVSFGADLGEYYDIPPGTGVTALVGLDIGFPIDIRVGRRTTTEGGTGRDVTYEWIELGPRFKLCQEGASICGDWFLGVGSYDLKLDDLEFDTAPGAYLGMGVEEIISDKYIGRFEVKGVYWNSDTFTTDGASLNVALFFGFKF